MSTKMLKPKGDVQGTSVGPLVRLRQEMDDLVARFWDGEQPAWLAGTLAPAVDLIEEPNAFEIRMDIPGLEAKDIDVQVHGNTLTLSGQRNEEHETKGRTFHRVERRSGNFSRTITLPCAVHEDEVVAEYVQGVLTVKLPKCEAAQSKKISVKG
ncbi:MAG: Hsp20/alpha crystallin family protein [Pirellulales bacterium]